MRKRTGRVMRERRERERWDEVFIAFLNGRPKSPPLETFTRPHPIGLLD